MTIQEWKDRNRYAKRYAHFDKRVSLERVWNYISVPENIIKHSFYPFIHYTQKFNKYSNGQMKEKKRELCYSAHIDRYIYSYYGYLINEKYNQMAIKEGINDIAIAYRTNLGLNNINFAKRAIDKIRESENCYIIVGDFTSFFDNLDHRYLKAMLCSILEMEKLSDDFYAVFKNITQYATWQLEDILNYYGLKNNISGIRKLNKKDVIFTTEEFRKLKKENKMCAKKNPNQFGIPQGSAISAVLSNVYMVEVDKAISKFVNKFDGLYMRYSDDMIIVLPELTEDVFIESYKKIIAILKSIPKLELQKEKTQIYYYCEEKLSNCNKIICDSIVNGNNKINYLGFSFDGKEVTIRDKTITKYYYRMYRKLKHIVRNNGVTKKGKRISPKNVYIKYSIKGANIKKDGNKGNFITYVKRAEKIWGNEPIGRSTKRHMLKIRRELDKVKIQNID